MLYKYRFTKDKEKLTCKLLHAHKHIRYIWPACCFLYDNLSRKWSRCYQQCWEEAETCGLPSRYPALLSNLKGNLKSLNRKPHHRTLTAVWQDDCVQPGFRNVFLCFFNNKAVSDTNSWTHCMKWIFLIKAGLMKISLQRKIIQVSYCCFQ